jgi:hypothetical protein
MNSKILSASMKYGLILACISIFIDVIIWSTKTIERLGLITNGLIGFITLAISIFVLIYLIKKYRDQFQEGRITFSQAFVLGLTSIIFASIIEAVYTFSFHTWIDPGYAARTVEVVQEKMYELFNSMGSPEEQIEKAMAQYENMKIPTPIQSMFGQIKSSFIGGAILSLIAAAIVRKAPKGSSGFESAMNEIDED